jgi:large subunit ribosomal protein L9
LEEDVMDVILAKDFVTLGFTGDKVAVKNGYARNYLIPRGIAVEADSRRSKELAHKMHKIAAHRARLKKDADGIAAKLKLLSFEFTLKIGSQGKSFGSLGTKDIEAYLTSQGIEVMRKNILLQDQIKSGGEFPFNIRLHSEVSVPLVAKVKVEVPEAPKREDKGSAGRERNTQDADEIEALAELDR